MVPAVGRIREVCTRSLPSLRWPPGEMRPGGRPRCVAIAAPARVEGRIKNQQARAAVRTGVGALTPFVL